MSSSPLLPLFYIRMARPEDAVPCHRIDVECWGEESAATVEMLQDRIAIYPFGNFVAISRTTGEVIGSVWTVAIREKPITTWWEASGEGRYRGVCDPHSDLVFGVNLSARPSDVGSVGRTLVVRAIEAAWIAGKRMIFLGSRIPGYHKWNTVFRVDDYVYLRRSGPRVFFQEAETMLLREGPLFAVLRRGGLVNPREWPHAINLPVDTSVFDAELGLFLSISVAGCPSCIHRVLPDYFTDPESLNYAALVGLENPDYVTARQL
jgi:hypothetical protein